MSPSEEILSEAEKLSDIDKLISLINKSNRIVVLSGAGVSTLSGIPDFRSSNGLYSKEFGHMRVESILDIDFFLEHPDVFYSWAKGNWYIMEKYEPNIVHRTLRKMEERGKLSEGIFTQNIDMLHTLALSKKVYELHGSLKDGYCVNCHHHMSYNEISKIVNDDRVPYCPKCGHVIKPDIVFYGEPLSSSILMRAENAFKNADLCIVLGSSLVVNPAASLPYISAQYGKPIVIVNRDKTYLDNYAELKFDDLKEVFEVLEREYSK